MPSQGYCLLVVISFERIVSATIVNRHKNDELFGVDNSCAFSRASHYQRREQVHMADW